jgi:hypothetical protein
MTASVHQKALCALAAMLFGVTANGPAQEAGPALACSGGAGCPEPPITIAQMSSSTIGLAQVRVLSSGGMAFGMQENPEVVKRQPYQAQTLTEMKQTLADGSHIAQTTTATVARDSDGRTVRTQKLSTIGPWKSASDSSQTDGATLTTIFDPIANTHTDYTSDSNVAHVITMPSRPASGAVRTVAGEFAMVAPAPGDAGAGPVTFSVRGHAELPQPADDPAPKTESLGAKTIDGIAATGTRDATTIPAGKIGNDKDLVITRETWYSPDLKLVIQSTQTDPRFGETTYTLTNIQRSEPDPTLFQVPAGYKVEKINNLPPFGHSN